MNNSNKIVFFNIMSTVILQGIAFLSSPIFSRLLGTENFGVVSIYITWVSVVSVVFTLQAYSTLAVSKNDFTNEEQIKYQSSILSLSSFIYLIVSFFIIVFLNRISMLLQLSRLMILMILIQGFGQYCVNFLNYKNTYEFAAKKNFYLSTMVSVSNIGLSLILIYLMPKNINYWGRIFGQTITYSFFSIIICIYIFKEGKTFFNRKYWKFCIPLTIPIVFHNLSGLVLGQSDRIMLQFYENNSIVGIYSLAYSFSAVLSTIWIALNNSWCPFYFEYTRENKIKELINHSRNYLELFTVISIGFVLLTVEVYHLFSGSDFWEGTSLIYIFSIGHYMVFLYSFPVNYEFFHKKTKIIAYGTISAAICNIFLNFILIKKSGVIGAALATTIAHTLQFLFHHYNATRLNKASVYPYKLNIIYPYLVVFLIITISSYILVDFPIIRWTIGIMAGLFELSRIIKRRSIF